MYRDDDVVRCFIKATLKHSTFVARGAEGRGDTSKESKATKSNGRGLDLEEGS